MMKSCAWASRAARSIAARLGLLARAEGDILGDRAREEEDVLLDGRDLRAQRRPGSSRARRRRRSARGPDVDVVDAVDQLGQRALARTGLPDDRDGLTRRGAEGDVRAGRRRRRS